MGNGIKTFFKVLYIALGLIIAAFVAIITYNNYAITHIQNLAAAAVNEKNYSEIERIFGTFFSTKPELSISSDQYDLVVYPSVAFSSYSYIPATSTTDTVKYEQEDYSYYIYIVNPALDIINDVKSGNDLSNQSGIRLYFSDDKSFLYTFAVDSTYNKDLYKESPSTLNEAILYSKRNTFTAYQYLNYFDITITSSIINSAKAVAGSDSASTVKAISVVNSSGKDVAKYDINMDFSQDFYDIVKPYVTNYNKYIEDFKASSSNDEKKALTAEFENYFYGSNKDGFYYTFANNENCGVGYGKEYAYPWFLYLQAGGMTLVFVIVLFMLYMLLFHFQTLKNIAQRLTVGNRKKNYGRRGNVNVEASRISKVNSKPEEAKAIETEETAEETEAKSEE